MEIAETQSRLPVVTILILSAAASAFLCWLVYAHQVPPGFGARFQFLPGLNAFFNGLSAAALVVGYGFIRRRNIAAHRASMIAALVFSALFLVSYITNHYLHGEMRFPGPHNAVWHMYIVILISHILLSVLALPMVLITFFFALTGRFRPHKRIARWTYPIWLYVSVTGVVVYAMLAGWRV
jgi:putative membrane protein